MEKIAIILVLSLILTNTGNYDVENPPIFFDGEVSDSIFIKVKTTDDQVHWFTNMDLGEKYCWNHSRYEILSKVKKKLDTAMN